MQINSIGFIGQGWIGKHYADWFEQYTDKIIVRYDIEKFQENKHRIAKCDVVFVSVPTPTTSQGPNVSIVADVLRLVGKGKVAVIKSTIVPGTTPKLQEQYRDKIILFSPEFLAKKTVIHDVAYPERSFVGYVHDDHKTTAEAVLSIMPKAPVAEVMLAESAEIIKYAANCFLYTKVVFANLLFELCKGLDVDYETVARGMGTDSRIGMSHVHIDDEGGRGAGGCCFIKDMEAFRQVYDRVANNRAGSAMLESIIQKNIILLKESGKDIEHLCNVYGNDL